MNGAVDDVVKLLKHFGINIEHLISVQIIAYRQDVEIHCKYGLNIADGEVEFENKQFKITEIT